LGNLFAGESQIVVRRWLRSLVSGRGVDRQEIPIHVEARPQGRSANLDAVLGLSVAEDGFLARIPLVAGGRYFSSDDAFEAILPTAAADALGVTPSTVGETVLFLRGQEFRVVGILDDDRFRTIRDLDGQLLLPTKVEEGAELAEEGFAEIADREEADKGVLYVDSSSVLILPVDTLGRLEGQSPYSVSVRFDDKEPIWPRVERLLTATRAKFFVSSRQPFQVGEGSRRRLGSGVYYVGSGYRTSIGGLSILIIPLLISSTIILNTMLGAVYERKAEIAVYNAVGLNPTHIGMFFLAEAFVYSVIGSVGGYLIGQALSIVLNRFGLVQDINLNFSSLSVVYVIAFTIAVVMLSTLYPAHVATKAAVPSGKRKWSMPPHDGNVMRVPFPFIYAAGMLPGIMAYLEEYFARFSEASIGDMIAHPEGRSAGEDRRGNRVYTLQYHIALAPFDLGVTQSVGFEGRYDDEVQAHRIVMTVTRISGQDSNWVVTNRPFLEKLRQHMMHWRNLKPEETALFVERGRRAYGIAS